MLRIGFAGDRDISVRILQYLLNRGIKPLVLLVSTSKKASHDKKLIEICSYLSQKYILKGPEFRKESGIKILRELNLDYIISIHFPYIFPKEVLEIPRKGVLNLHPAYLPYNRGWHTTSWAILEGTPAGATLHFMDEGIDTGDIIYRETLEINPEDTAHTLYQRIKQLEYDIFVKAWPMIESGKFTRIKQNIKKGSIHLKRDLLRPEVQKLELESTVKVRDLLNRLRALTTNNIKEAAYFEIDGQKYRIQINIIPEK